MPSRSTNNIYAETLAVFDRNGGRHEPLTTPEVADALDAKRRTVYKRLQTLVDRGHLETKETGASSRVWWRPPAGSSGPTTPHLGAETEIPERSEEYSNRVLCCKLFEKIPDNIIIIDPTGGAILDANQQFCDMLGYTREELLELEFDALHAGEPPYTTTRAEQYIRKAATEGPQSFEWLATTKDGEHLPVAVHLRRTALGGTDRVLAVVRDISDRKEHERELTRLKDRFQALTRHALDLTTVIDENGNFRYNSPSVERILGYSPEELEGEDAFQYIHPDDRERVWERFTDTMNRPDSPKRKTEFRFKHADGSWIWLESVGNDEWNATLDGFVVTSRDITDRKQREQALATLHGTTRKLVGAGTPEKIADIASETAADVLNLPANAVYLYDETDDALVPVAVSSATAEIVGDAPAFRPGEGLAWQVFETGETQVHTDLRQADTLYNPETDIQGELIFPLGNRGVFIAGSTEVDAFDNNDVALAGILMANVETALDRAEREATLKRQREQTAALNEFNDVVRGITEVVIDQSTRTKIEQVVCDRLVEFDSYRAAVIYAADSSTQLEPQIGTGVDGTPDRIPLPTAPGDPADRDPVRNAACTQEIQIARNVPDDTDSEVNEHAREYGYRSVAAIPVSREGSLYGVIGVYSERADAFTDEVREIIGQLGEVVGHAISGVERKRALMNDEVVDLEFRMRDVEVLDLPASSDGTIIFDRMVPVGDGSYLVYGTATDDMMEAVHTLVDADITSHSGPVKIIEQSNNKTRFRLTMMDPQVLSTIVSHGGYVHEGRIENQQYYIQVRLPPGANVRKIIDTVTDTYPAAEMVTRTQMASSDSPPQQIGDDLTERLTERQRAALEAGYSEGFFEWPRDSSGEEVADSLNVSASTFHQHIRKAEKTLLDTIFEGS